MSRLPPLNALKAFEAAARHLSFTKGAEALNVSQSAISHQVRLLENHVGKALFERSPSGLTLTDVGTTLFKSVHEAFDLIMTAVSKTRGDPLDETIILMLHPFFSSRWVSARISKFHEKYPDYRITLLHTHKKIDFENGNFDIAIILGNGKLPNMDVELLAPCELTPLCSPRFCDVGKKPTKLCDLKTNTLLHEGADGNWSRWLTLAGDPNPSSRRHLFIDDTNVRIQAAIKGLGVVLSNPKLLFPEIEKGDLIAPFDIMLTDYSYYMISPRNRLMKRKIQILKEWLIEQAASLQ